MTHFQFQRRSAKNLMLCLSLTAVLAACNSSTEELSDPAKHSDSTSTADAGEPFEYVAEQFADLRVLRYKVNDFNTLDLKTKTLLYYLYEAALCGRDINYDQN